MLLSEKQAHKKEYQENILRNLYTNFRLVFQATRYEPLIAFCTPEYLFGSPSTGSCLGTVGQFSMLLVKKDRIGVIAIDEAYKIF